MAYDVGVVGASSAALVHEPDWSALRRLRDEARRLRQVAGRTRRNSKLLGDEARNSSEQAIWIRWHSRQLRYDRFGPIVAVWTGDQPWQAPAHRVTSGAQISRHDEGVFEPVIGQLFSITVEISSALSLNDDPELARRLQQILHKTDDVISEIRKVASKASFDGEPETLHRNQLRGGCPSEDRARDDVQPRELAATLLADAIHTIDRLARFARDNSQAAAIDLEQASHAAHRALVVLAPRG